MIAELATKNAQIAPPAPGGVAPSDADFHADIVNVPAKLCSLPPLNSIASRVIALADNLDCDLKRMATVVEGDPAFAAEVLFLANSPLFGFPSKLQVLHHAIAILGSDRIKSLAMTVAMRAFVGSGSPLIRQCWRHSTACAVIAERISPIFALESDQGYAAALMHDIGRLGLLKSYPRQMSPVLESEHRDLRDVLVAERAAINVDHQLAGAWLVKHWALPEPFVEICEHHHDPLENGDSALLQVVKIACRLADSIGYAAVQCQPLAAYRELISAMPEGIHQERFPDEEELRNHVETRLASFEQ